MKKLATCFSIRSFCCFSFQELSQFCDHREHFAIKKKSHTFQTRIQPGEQGFKGLPFQHFSSLLQTAWAQQNGEGLYLIHFWDAINSIVSLQQHGRMAKCSVFIGAVWLQGKDRAPSVWRAHNLGQYVVSRTRFLTSNPNSIIYNSDCEQIIQLLCVSVRFG